MIATRVTKDKCGQPIRPGSYIVYAHLLGRSAALKFGRVQRIEWVPKKTWGPRTEIVPRFVVRGVEEFFAGYELCYPGRLLFPERIVVLDRSQIPEKHLRLLDLVEVFGEDEPTTPTPPSQPEPHRLA